MSILRVLFIFFAGLILVWAIPGYSASVIYNSSGSYIEGIDGLLVGSDQYNVTFRDDSFLFLWNSGDMPTFWNDAAGAEAASLAINNILNNECSNCSPSVADAVGLYYLVPYNSTVVSPMVLSMYNSGLSGSGYEFASPLATTELTGSFIYANFTVIPIPAAAWLFCSGLVGLFGFARHKL